MKNASGEHITSFLFSQRHCLLSLFHLHLPLSLSLDCHLCLLYLLYLFLSLLFLMKIVQQSVHKS
jgi:hypothetical protein